jgi:hypothetical protein
MVLLSAQGMDVAAMARSAVTSEDRVRDVIRNFKRGRVRVAVPEVEGRPPAEVQPAASAGDQEDRQVEAGRP